jgi:hypothetical protein
MMADRAAFPLGIKDGGVAIRGKHQNLLVCQYAGESFYELAQTISSLAWIGEQTSKKWDFSGCSVVSRVGQRASPSDERYVASRHAWRQCRVSRFDREAARRIEKELGQAAPGDRGVARVIPSKPAEMPDDQY